MKDVLAVIPARGGSKGVPRKNLQKVAGRSLLARAIGACVAAGIDRIVVSSDDQHILEEAARHGASPLRRPESLSGDTATTEDALIHALDKIQGPPPAILVLVQCTSPFLQGEDVAGVVDRVRKTADVAFTAYPTHVFLWQDRGEGVAEVNHDMATRPRRQDMAPQYAESGGAYAMRVDGFRKARHRFFGNVAIHPVRPWNGMEVDTVEDLVHARALAAVRRELPPAAQVDAIVFDFDGVMSDDRVETDQDGKESVQCSRSDGLGLEMLREAGIPAFVISKEKNPVVAARCKKLGIPCIQGTDHKEAVLRAWLERTGYDAGRVAFVGNDVNDLDCLRLVGHSIGVADAQPEVIAAVDWVTQARGGRGAVREVCQWALLGR